MPEKSALQSAYNRYAFQEEPVSIFANSRLSGGLHPQAIRDWLSGGIRYSAPPPESLPCINVQIPVCRAVAIGLGGESRLALPPGEGLRGGRPGPYKKGKVCGASWAPPPTIICQLPDKWEFLHDLYCSYSNH